MRKVLVVAAIVLLALSSQAQARVCVPGNTVTLTWLPNSEPDLAGYEVEQAESPEGPFTKIHTGLVAEATHVVTGLAEGTYCWRVRAVDTCGNRSEPSDVSELAAVDLTPPQKPAGLSLTAGE